LGDHVIVPPHWPIRMALTEAIQLKNNAGNTLPFQSVNLRWPLSPGNDEPLYIFRDTSGKLVFVGVESSRVTQLSFVRGQTPGQLQLCTAQGIVYKAYRRPYAPNAPHAPFVLILLASCYHLTSPWEILFQVESVGDTGFRFKLMEKPPRTFNHIQTFYTASFGSPLGFPELPDEVAIVDANGEHIVKLEDLS
jgi:hypothetical protein